MTAGSAACAGCAPTSSRRRADLRRLSLAAGFALIVLAFAAASRVTDTRAGLVAEIVTLLGGLAGIGLLTYAFAARPRHANRPSPQPSPLKGRGGMPPSPQPCARSAARTARNSALRLLIAPLKGRGGKTRSKRDLVLGAAGVLLAVILLTGLAISGGILWAGFGLALLLPMIAGSLYLCVRFLRANP